MPYIKRALISVYDKTEIVEFAKLLSQYNIKIISTGGTAQYLNEHGVKTTSVSEITGFPEILNGRVKTLHPKILGGILALRDSVAQIAETESHGVNLIDLVVVNLYPFEETIAKKESSLFDALENIDIGGPTMIRAAAKNYPNVVVVTSPHQYKKVGYEIKNNQGQISIEMCKNLACEAFELTSRYDACIHTYLAKDIKSTSKFPERLQFQFEKVQDLRYGENPHQQAALYKIFGSEPSGIIKAKQLHGKELSFNNLLDLNTAYGLVQEFQEPCAAIIKHSNPCGLSITKNISDAYLKARETDPVSSFGGIVGLNRMVDVDTARAIAEIFTEAVIVPEFTPEALKILQTKKNLRLLVCSDTTKSKSKELDFKKVQGGMLIQDQDFYNLSDINFRVVTKRQPTESEWTALKLGWRVTKWVKSNAIVFTTDDRTIGIGAGQMSRVDSTHLAIEKAENMGHKLEDTAVASDAFYPFRDGIDLAAQAGATAVIQPGGSIRDQEVIQAADENNMSMVFTNVRHFRH